MEILFENRSVRTPEVHKQLQQHNFFKRTSFIITIILMSIFFLKSLLSLILWAEVYHIAVLIVIPLFFLYVFLRYRSTVKTLMKRDAEQFGNTFPEFRTVVFPHQFQYTTQIITEPITVPFSSIQKAFTTKDLIVLQSEARLLYVFHKDGFAKGSEQEFINFLKLLGIKCR